MSATRRSCTDMNTALIFTLLRSTFITFGNLGFWPEAEWIIYNTGPEILLIIRRLIRNPEIECDTVIVSMYSRGLCDPAFPCNRSASTPAHQHACTSFFQIQYSVYSVYLPTNSSPLSDHQAFYHCAPACFSFSGNLFWIFLCLFVLVDWQTTSLDTDYE